MAEYIERGALMAEIYRIGGHNLCEWDTIGVKALVARQPTADVVEVRYGEWEEHDRYICNSDDKPVAKIGTIYICSECGRQEHRKEPYCHCGAKMDGKGDGR